MLPSSDEQPPDGLSWLCEADGTPVAADFHDVETYRALRLGPYHPDSRVALPLSSADQAFFAETLRQAKEFRALMTCRTDITYPPIGVVASDAAPSAVTWSRPAPDQPFDLDEPRNTVPGDGYFLYDTAGPPVGVPVAVRLTSKKSHAGVAADMPQIESALDALLDAGQQRKEEGGAGNAHIGV